jgi:hypothetical protein
VSEKDHILVEWYMELGEMVKSKSDKSPSDTARVPNKSKIGAMTNLALPASRKERPASKGRVHKGKTRN